MAEVVIRSTQPALGAIKLAWWRERLEELDEGKVPAEPRLQAVAAELLPTGLLGKDLAQLEDGWLALLEPTPDSDRIANRGATLFALAAQLIGDAPPILVETGRLYALGNLRRLGLATEGVHAAVPTTTVPSPFRRLTGLAVLAQRDLVGREPEGTPARAWALLKHRLTGGFPR